MKKIKDGTAIKGAEAYTRLITMSAFSMPEIACKTGRERRDRIGLSLVAGFDSRISMEERNEKMDGLDYRFDGIASWRAGNSRYIENSRQVAGSNKDSQWTASDCDRGVVGFQ
jgi:hypothetical protein